MNAIKLNEYNSNVLRALLSLKLGSYHPLDLSDDEVLVDLHASTCNPSDIAFICGAYNIVKPLPAVPGFEASGIVSMTGENTHNLLGKKISCFVQSDKSGTWAEQFIVHKKDLIILSDDFNMDQAAAFSVNPFTAYGLVKIAKKRNSKAIIQNAAGGQVAEFIRILAKKEGLNVINILRKPQSAKMLLDAGEQFVLCEQDENFEEDLIELANNLSGTIAFDAVGGDLSGKLINAMPAESELIVYGGLSGQRISGINEMDLIFANKKISGFNLIDWKVRLEKGEFDIISKTLQEMFIKEELVTKIQGETTLDNIIDGLKIYLKNMSAGKLLIKP